MGFSGPGLCDACQFEATADDPWVINYYQCECGCQWQDQADAACSDSCPECTTVCEPYNSVTFD